MQFAEGGLIGFAIGVTECVSGERGDEAAGVDAEDLCKAVLARVGAVDVAHGVEGEGIAAGADESDAVPVEGRVELGADGGGRETPDFAATVAGDEEIVAGIDEDVMGNGEAIVFGAVDESGEGAIGGDGHDAVVGVIDEIDIFFAVDGDSGGGVGDGDWGRGDCGEEEQQAHHGNLPVQ